MARKPKRVRTAFNPNQLLQLEQAFEKNQYVVGQERKQLANSLQLSETQVILRLPTRCVKHTVCSKVCLKSLKFQTLISLEVLRTDTFFYDS